jgi:rod shape-determining protein MreC
VPLLDLRQRSGHLFLAVMLGHILLISAQVNSASGVPILETVTFGLVSEGQRLASSIVSGAVGVWSGYIGLRHVKVENDALKQEIAEARVAVQEQRALAARTVGLQRLLDLRASITLRTEAAEIIGGAANSDFRTVTVNKGTTSGIRADMAVLAPAGVVGRVVAPSLRAAKVQLLIDRNAAAGALVERTRAQGIVMGGSDERLLMEYVSDAFDVLVGDVVVTSGIDGIYPKGFVIGRVEIVEKSGGGYRRIVVKPAVNFSGLEEVLVVTSPTPSREAAAGVSE